MTGPSSPRRGLLVRAGALASAVLFTIAAAFPAVATCQPGAPGFPTWFENSNILLFGWAAVLFGQVGWFANIPYVLTVGSLLMSRPVRARTTVIQAVLLAAGTLALLPAVGMEYPHSEAGSDPVCRLGAGFYLWLAAQIVALALAVATRRAKAGRQPAGHPPIPD